MSITTLTTEVDRILAAERKYGHEDEPMTDEQADAFEQTLSDETWLAAVAALLADHTSELDEAVEAIEANRVRCLKARSLGFTALEMSQAAADRMGLTS